ncbi:EAL domain-containing protein [Ramlibacter sp. H39-3-26]|nr:EAL domain-containing protein [Ramlibacter sp. H39-3-26]MDF1485745.1 EAL domain-containing protein [Ramlibacter sp. H39-3-26]
MLIYALDLTAVIYVSGILIHEKYLSIDFTRKEIVGMVYSDAVRSVLLSPFLPGAPAPAPRALEQLARVRITHDEVLHTTEQSAAFVKSRDAVLREGTGPQRDMLLRDMLRRGRELLTTVGNQSNLILDPDLDSYYAMSLVMLRFPELLEALHETAMMEGVRSMSQADRRTQLLTLAGRIDAVGQGMRSDFTQVFAAGSPALRAALASHREVLEGRADAFLGQMRKLADRSDAGTADFAMLQNDYAQTLEALGSTWVATARELDRLLAQRESAQFARMWLHLGTALLLLGCILSLVYAVARQIAWPLRQLAGVADEVRRTGDHTRRARWHSSDEIGQLVVAFNDMLAQLDSERLTQQELAASARAALMQQEMVEAIPIALVVTSIPYHEVLHANAPARPWLGDCASDPWRMGLEPGVRSRFFQHMADQGKVDEFEVRWLGGGGEPSWAVLSARRLQFRGSDAMLTAFTPINMLKLMERRLELWAKVFEASSEGIIIMDAAQKVLSINHAFCRSTSYDYYEVLGEQFAMLLDEPDAPGLAQRIAQAIDERDAWQGEVRFRKRSGETYPAWLMVSAVREVPKPGPVSHYIGISVDITDRKRTEARVQFLAEHDVLTELPNRSLCVECLQVALFDAAQHGGKVAVLFIDLDRFKGINDTLGHHIGDGLLRSVAERLKLAVRAGDTVSRLGGDEFVVVMRDVTDREEVRHVVEHRLIPLIRQSHHVEGHDLQVSCSVGVALYPLDGASTEDLMRRADAAMYQAKSGGRDMVSFYAPEIDLLVQQRQTLEHHLRHALERGELHLHYQPRVDTQTLDVVGAEVLLRWQHPDLGAVQPGRFIPLAEETGLIRPIGMWVLREACMRLAAWEAEGRSAIDISVNLSAAQLTDPALLDGLRQCLRDSGCNPGRLELEITESHLMDNASAAEAQLIALKTLGVKLSIDDFGTGYSSLAYLKRFPIDKLKIDQSFVHDLLTDPTDLAIIRAIIALGHNLGLVVVAEGVEEGQEARQLRYLGCDELQGFHFARPMPLDAFLTWMSQHKPFASRTPQASAR